MLRSVTAEISMLAKCGSCLIGFYAARLLTRREPTLQEIGVFRQNSIPAKFVLKALLARGAHLGQDLRVAEHLVQFARELLGASKIHRSGPCDPAIERVVMGDDGIAGAVTYYKRRQPRCSRIPGLPR